MVSGQSGQSGQSVTLSVEVVLDRGTEPVLLLLPRIVDGTVRAWPCRARAVTASPAPKTSPHRQVTHTQTVLLFVFKACSYFLLPCGCWSNTLSLTTLVIALLHDKVCRLSELCLFGCSGCINGMVLVTEADCQAGMVEPCPPTCSHLTSTSNCTATCILGRTHRRWWEVWS